MAQLSMPYRIAVVGLLVLAAVWFAVLRPGAAVQEPSPPLPGEVVPGAVGQAQGAAAAGDARTAGAPAAPGAAATDAAASSGTATGGAAATDAAASSGTATGGTAALAAAVPAEPAAPRAPAAGPRDPSLRLLGALDEGRAVVLLFTDGRGADDREVRRAVARVDRRAGSVVVRTVPLRDVGRYEAITRGVAVAASPTVLVLGPARDAQAIVGLTTAREVGQAVGDALDVGDDPVAAARVARAAALRRAERACDGVPACLTHFTAANDACVRAVQAAPSGAGALAAHQAARAAAAGAAAGFAAVPSPAAQRAGHARAGKVLQARVAAYDRALAGAADGGQVARRLRADAAVRGAGSRLRQLGYGACA